MGDKAVRVIAWNQAFMSETTSATLIGAARLPRPARGAAGMPGAAALISVSLHAAIIGAALLILSPLPPPPGQSSVALAFEPPAEAALSTLAADRITPPESTAFNALTPTLPGRSVRATVPEGHPHPLRAAAALPFAPAQAKTPAPTPLPAPSPGDVAGLKLRIREAVLAATLYPAVARQMHREGRAQISFAYRDGIVQGVALIQTSRSGLLDEAALAAVRRATYPLPPPGLTGVRLALDVWVNFGLKAE